MVNLHLIEKQVLEGRLQILLLSLMELASNEVDWDEIQYFIFKDNLQLCDKGI